MTRSEADDDGLRWICSRWCGGGAVRLRPLAADGFSGAALVLATPGSGGGEIVLKPAPVASRPRLEWVHRLMRHLRDHGCREVPEVLECTAGGTLVDDGRGSIWEAVRFVAGSTSDTPTAGQAAAALDALARVHLAAAAWPAAPPTVGPAAAVARRRAQAALLLADPWRPPASDAAGGNALGVAMTPRLDRARALAREHDLAAALRGMAGCRPPDVDQHAVLQDVWCGHVLFAAEGPPRVAGFVDFHAAAVDTPATDVARLIGSWRRDADAAPDAAWAGAVAAYERVRPLTAVERSLIPWLDATGTILGLDNWLRWVLVEGRRFANPGQVLERVDRLLARLPSAIAVVGRGGAAV